MIVGVPREIKDEEYRVGIVPAGVRALVGAGHQVLVESGAGGGCLIADPEYARAGADVVGSAAEVYGRADMIVKVKEPQTAEYDLLREGQILFAYLHLAPAPELTTALLNSGVQAMAFETIQTADGSLPLLTPMSEVAGRMAVTVGAEYLTKAHGGRGVLLGGVPGVTRGRVAILGGGVVGLAATKIAVGVGAEVTVLDVSQKRLFYLDDIFGSRITTLMSNHDTIRETVIRSHLVVGAVLIPGAKAPRLVTRDMVGEMKSGSVIVDVSVDQGGCTETCRPTTHAQPVYVIDDVIHYCVANIPSMVSRTSTFALANVTMPYVMKIAELGLKRAIHEDPALARGLNLAAGRVTHPNVAVDLGYDYTAPVDVL
ncbi:MAG: alanine dehydrogenase [Proteobacteria bacterium]|nr:alanine dehydrogenase [Pseudomonadota bacterium]